MKDTPFSELALIKATFKDRPTRFTVECLLKGRSVRAYLANPGRLWELFLPGRTIYLVKNPSKDRLPYTAVAIEKEGMPIPLHTHLTNDLIEGLIREGKIPGLEDVEVIRREVSFGGNRYDLLLRRGGRPLVLEAKTCTLFGHILAMFPDAITIRGSHHIKGLLRLKEEGIDVGILFVVHWPLARYFMPDYHTDLEFSRNLLGARGKLLIKAIAVRWEDDLSLSGVKELLIPWELIEREAQDRGSYIALFSLAKGLHLKIGKLREVYLRRGYYLYVGSAKRDLTKRMERHRRKRKRAFWHIDYLTKVASFYKGLPIRTSLDIECELSQRLKGVSEWSIPGFGSSDCSCESHLFGMEGDPIKSSPFIGLLQDFRIGAIEKRWL